MNAPAPSRWLKEAADKGVILAACQNTMRAMKVKTEDLFLLSTEVDSGVSELVRKHLKNPMAPTC